MIVDLQIKSITAQYSIFCIKNGLFVQSFQTLTNQNILNWYAWRDRVSSILRQELLKLERYHYFEKHCRSLYETFAIIAQSNKIWGTELLL